MLSPKEQIQENAKKNEGLSEDILSNGMWIKILDSCFITSKQIKQQIAAADL